MLRARTLTPAHLLRLELRLRGVGNCDHDNAFQLGERVAHVGELSLEIEALRAEHAPPIEYHRAPSLGRLHLIAGCSCGACIARSSRPSSSCAGILGARCRLAKAERGVE